MTQGHGAAYKLNKHTGLHHDLSDPALLVVQAVRRHGCIPYDSTYKGMRKSRNGHCSMNPHPVEGIGLLGSTLAEVEPS